MVIISWMIFCMVNFRVHISYQPKSEPLHACTKTSQPLLLNLSHYITTIYTNPPSSSQSEFPCCKTFKTDHQLWAHSINGDHPFPSLSIGCNIGLCFLVLSPNSEVNWSQSMAACRQPPGSLQEPDENAWLDCQQSQWSWWISHLPNLHHCAAFLCPQTRVLHSHLPPEKHGAYSSNPVW